MNVLEVGDRGPDVAAWQNFLLSRGISVGPHGADGHFGPDTASATRAFQTSVGVRVHAQGAVTSATAVAANARGFGNAANQAPQQQISDTRILTELPAGESAVLSLDKQRIAGVALLSAGGLGLAIALGKALSAARKPEFY